MTVTAPQINRRDVIAALAALGALTPTLALASPWDGPASPGAQRVGQAWLAQNPGTTTASLLLRLAPDGWSLSALERLKIAVARDFREGRVFRYRGWRLSDTEGALFALAVA